MATLPLLLTDAPPARLRRKKGQQFMCRYDVWHVRKDDWTATLTAKTDTEARKKHFYSLSDAFRDIRYIDIRSRLVQVLYPIGQPVPVEERRKLEVMRHALGLKDYIGEGTAYRNHFASGPDSTDWDVLMELSRADVPLMGRRNASSLAEGMVYFHVTLFGKDWVDKRIGMSTDPESGSTDRTVVPVGGEGTHAAGSD